MKRSMGKRNRHLHLMPSPQLYDRAFLPLTTVVLVRIDHKHRTDKYLDTLLANQTSRKAKPPITTKRVHRKMADCPSFAVIGYAEAGRRRSPMTCRLL